MSLSNTLNANNLYRHSQRNTYENVSMCPMFKKKSRPIKAQPVYANLHSVRMQKNRRQQPGDKWAHVNMMHCSDVNAQFVFITFYLSQMSAHPQAFAHSFIWAQWKAH